MDSQIPGPPEQQPSTAYPPSGAGDRKKGLKTWALIGVGAAALVLGGAGISVASSSADPPAQAPTTQSPPTDGPGHDGMHRGHGVGGTIASVDGSNLTVTDRSGATVTVTTTADTRITRSTKGAVGDVNVGDNVVVLGPTTGTDVTAKMIVDSRATPLPARPPKDAPDADHRPPPGDHPGPVVGQVTAVDGATITVQGASATFKVTTSADTRVSLVETIGVGDLKVGEHVQVMGQTTGSTVAAVAIRVGDIEGPGPGMHGPGMPDPGMHGPGMPGPDMHGPGRHHRGPDGDQDDSGTDSSGSSGTTAPTTL